MSVFDPNKDYTKTTDQASLYDTVMEVQKVLQEITNILQMEEDERIPIQSGKQPQRAQTVLPEEQPELYEDEDEDQSTIYDNIFE
jgi:hypothetical protein